MTFVVPFDGSDLAEAALVRAAEFSDALEEPVLAVSVIPEGNAEYARERGWIGPEEAYDLEAVVATLHRQVTDLHPAANFRHALVDRYAPSGTISKRIRQLAREVDASMVVVGSENAGRVVNAMATVGTSVAADEAYDVVIVRHRRPSKIASVRGDEASYPSGFRRDD
ncbi:universal stress protein [Halopiger goleimassiliensis]|uniref:universal stress protein n=1 Tax=Halopiger goleimassiliensis TaxID=1293048 RepID=UPI0006777835|nr:universal stress protein [Halopiger goleimassiliensis]